MKFSKQTSTEIGLGTLFCISTLATYLSVTQLSTWTYSLLGASFWGVVWISAIGWYASMEVDETHTPWVVGAHSLLLFTPLFISRSLNLSLILLLFLFATLFGASLFWFLRVINREIDQRVSYHPRRIVFPYIGRLIVMIMLLASLLVYFRVLDAQEGTEGLEIPESTVSEQIQLAEPLIQQILPEYQPGIEVRDFVKARLNPSLQYQSLTPEQQQLFNQEGMNDRLVDQQIQSLETQFDIQLDPNQSVESATIQGVNVWLKKGFGSVIGPVIIAVLSSLFVFVGLASLIPIYMIVVKITIMLITRIMAKTDYMQTRTEQTTRTTYTL